MYITANRFSLWYWKSKIGKQAVSWWPIIKGETGNDSFFVFYFQNEKRYLFSDSMFQDEHFDFQYLFMVCDFFGCDPEAILSPHITHPCSTSMESCSIVFNSGWGKFCSLLRRKTSYAEWQWHVSGHCMQNFLSVSPCSAHHLLTFLSEKNCCGAPNWLHKAVEISPHVIPLVWKY